MNVNKLNFVDTGRTATRIGDFSVPYEAPIFEAEGPDGVTVIRTGEGANVVYSVRVPGFSGTQTLDAYRDFSVRSRRRRSLPTRVGAAFHDPNFFEDGSWRYPVHGVRSPRERDREQPVIEDLACDEGREHWPDYVRLPDGREGPRPFRNLAEKRAYMRLTGHAEK